jgi:hypothetical protein
VGLIVPNACNDCGAWNYLTEKGQSDGRYAICCGKGNAFPVSQDQTLKRPPDDLVALLTDATSEAREFRNHIRNYNSSFAMASIINKKDSVMGTPGPFVYKANGQSYTAAATSMLQGDGSTPKFAQLWIVESSAANQFRLNDPANESLSPHAASIMSRLDLILRESNVLIERYVTMGEKIREEETLAAAEGRQPRTVSMTFVRDPTRRSRTDNLPTKDEVAIVYVGDGPGCMPGNYELAIYSRNPDPSITGPGLQRIKSIDLKADPMAFPPPAWRRLQTSTSSRPSCW